MKAASFELKGRRALVTGASSGLGRHFARCLAVAGADVVLAARSVERLKQTEREIRNDGGSVLSIPLDVKNLESVRRAFDLVDESGEVVDIIVNNAGVAVSRPVIDQTEADWDAVIDTNLKGTWQVAQEAARRLIKVDRRGAIVNIASITGERVAGGVVPYCTSKAGVIHLTRTMALELARHGIRVNALAPGYVKTELNGEFLESEAGQRLKSRIPQRRFGTPEDLTGPLLLLASDAGSYMTGSVLFTDGGHLVSSL